ncbi:MAG: class II aldolase/adducin family protein [Sulfuricaulis sp.]|uniref:class II aldolase/adducin family protein n=1 Tax=Sulfuricaulis sp. TaxID=2003553 RepID=UPI0034A30E07
MDELLLTKHFVTLSRYAGSRFDLLQAGGGNSSVKLDDRRMLVKASGVLLSEVESGKGYAVVDYPEIAAILETPSRWGDDDKHRRDSNVSHLIALGTITPGARASIEVFLHAILGKFVLHTHPIGVNIIASQSDWDKNLTALFPDALCVPYRTPGIELGLELNAQVKKYIANYGYKPQLIFLQNHGLIVSAESMEAVQQITEDTVGKCCEWSRVDLGRYKQVTAIANFVGDGSVAYLCEDRAILDLLKTQKTLFSLKPYCPDGFVFCGAAPLVVENLSDPGALDAYRVKYHDTPKVILYDGQIYFIAKNTKKTMEIEEVYKAHLLTLASMKGRINSLSDEALTYLSNWDAEKYRRDM